MKHSALFHGSPGCGDTEYLRWLDDHPTGFVTNIPHPHMDFSSFTVVMHRAD